MRRATRDGTTISIRALGHSGGWVIGSYGLLLILSSGRRRHTSQLSGRSRRGDRCDQGSSTGGGDARDSSGGGASSEGKQPRDMTATTTQNHLDKTIHTHKQTNTINKWKIDWRGKTGSRRVQTEADIRSVINRNTDTKVSVARGKLFGASPYWGEPAHVPRIIFLARPCSTILFSITQLIPR